MGEDLAHIEILCCAKAGAPEKDEEVDEEDSCSLSGLVGAACVDGLEGAFADEGYEDATGADEHKLAPAKFVDKKCGEAVPGEGCCGPESQEEERHVA